MRPAHPRPFLFSSQRLVPSEIRKIHGLPPVRHGLDGQRKDAAPSNGVIDVDGRPAVVQDGGRELFDHKKISTPVTGPTRFLIPLLPQRVLVLLGILPQRFPHRFRLPGRSNGVHTKNSHTKAGTFSRSRLSVSSPINHRYVQTLDYPSGYNQIRCQLDWSFG